MVQIHDQTMFNLCICLENSFRNLVIHLDQSNFKFNILMMNPFDTKSLLLVKRII